jgi:hypothetical protein
MRLRNSYIFRKQFPKAGGLLGSISGAFVGWQLLFFLTARNLCGARPLSCSGGTGKPTVACQGRAE